MLLLVHLDDINFTHRIPYRLFRFISEHVPASTSSTSSMSTVSVSNLLLKQASEERQSPLDKGYALRTIMRSGRHFRSAVKLYMGFGMRQQAVELALKVGPALARELARQSDDKDETKRLVSSYTRTSLCHNRSFIISPYFTNLSFLVAAHCKECSS